MSNPIGRWIDSRLGLSQVLHAFLERLIPPGVNWFYTLGSATTTTFLIMVVTGVLLTNQYQAAPQVAYDSLVYINQHVVFGAFIRNLHHWGATAMVVLVAAHMTRTFYWGAYKFPRELTWMSGALLLIITLAFAFTGYLLPWDQKSFWTTVLLTRMAETTPLVGEWARTIIQGGPEIGSHTLTRFFSFHAMILPAVMAALVGLHLALVIRQGISAPPRFRREPYADAPNTHEAYLEHYQDLKKHGEPFYINILEDAIVSLGVVIILFIAASLLPAPLEKPANPIGVGYAPRPEWYFLWLFQLLRYFPGKLEPVGVIGVPLLLGVILLVVPMLDWGPRRHPVSRPITVTMWTLAGLAIVWLTYTGANQRPPNVAGGQNVVPVSNHLSAKAMNGWKVFYSFGCVNCHQVGTVGGQVGPNLTNIGSRRDRAFLTRWVRNPQAIKPGTIMPAFPQIPPDQYEALITFLTELK